MSSWSSAALAYLTGHGISTKVAEMAGVTEKDGSLVVPWPGTDGRPSWRRRSLNGAGWQQEPGSAHGVLWPFGAPRPGDPGTVLVTEGAPDALAAWSVATTSPGQTADLLADNLLAVAAVTSTSMPAERLVAALTAAGVTNVVLALDGDDAGRKATIRFGDALGEAGIRAAVLELPDGDDLADVLARVPDPGAWLLNSLLDAQAAGAPDEPGSPDAPNGDRGPGLAEPTPAAALRFLTIEELRGLAPPSVEWVWEGYLAPGAVTLLGGKPKVGKSTLVGDLITASVTGASSFLGRRVRGGPVVYVAEEGISTLLDKLPDHPDLRVLTRETAWPKPTWATVVEAATREAVDLGAWLVFDTWGYWAGLGPDAEKDAGATLKAVAALNRATRAGLAVVLVHHQRKAGGSDGDAFRGSNALTGAVDALVEMERPGEDSPPGHRQIVAVSRWRDVTPPLLLVDRDVDGSWKVLGEGGGREEAVGLGWRGRVLEAIPEAGDVTVADLIALLGEGKRHWNPVLLELVKDGLVEREGEGRKGDPYRYRRARGEPPEKAVPESCSLSVPPRDQNAEKDALSIPVPDPVGGGGIEPHLGTEDAVPVRKGEQHSADGSWGTVRDPANENVPDGQRHGGDPDREAVA